MDSGWNNYFMRMAMLAATRSKDRSKQVGCVIVSSTNNVLSTGYNGFPRGCFDSAEEVMASQPHIMSGYIHTQLKTLAEKVEARHERPAKYMWTEHAERNAIYNAARHGVRLEGAKIYVPWFPCADCMRAIIQSGITMMVCEKPDLEHPRWGADFKLGLEMAAEASLVIEYMELPTQFESEVVEAQKANVQPAVN